MGCIADHSRASQGTGRPVECRQEPIAGGFNFLAAESLELSRRDLVVLGKDIVPGDVAELHEPGGGIH